MSADTEVRVKTKVSVKDMEKLTAALKKVRGTVKDISKSNTQLRNTNTRLGKQVTVLTNRLGRVNKRLDSTKSKSDRSRIALAKLRKTARSTGKDFKGLGDDSKKAGSSLGFTGLAFGFVGASAAFAANQITDKFMKALNDGVGLISEANRIGLFSDASITQVTDGVGLYNASLEQGISLANKYGLELADAFTLIKTVNKSAPPNVDSAYLADIVAGLKLIENEVDAGKLTADFTTIAANFPNVPLDEIVDYVFAFSKATKLSFSAGSKTIAFAAGEAKRLNTDLGTLFKTLAAIVGAVPGDRGNAGRGLRALIGDIAEPKIINNLKLFGVNLLNAKNEFVGVDVALESILKRFREIDAVNQGASNEFLDIIGLDRNAITTLLAYASQSEEAKEAIATQFDTALGGYQAAVASQVSLPEADLNRLKNIVSELSISFTSGLGPALGEINTSLREIFSDPEIIDAIKVFGNAIGTTLVDAFKIVAGILKLITPLFKENEALIKLLGVAVVGLVAALHGMAIIFPILGGFFALIFLHEKLIQRSTDLGKEASIVTRAYAKLFRVLGRVRGAFARVFKAIGAPIAKALAPSLNRLAGLFLRVGFRAGAFFGTAFNIVSNAVIGVGKWLVSLGKRLAVTFLGMGTGSGGVFGAAFTAASEPIIGAGAWLKRLFGRVSARMVSAGAAAGGAFGSAWTATTLIIMGIGSWLSGLLSSFKAKMLSAGAVQGGTYGTAWTGASTAIMAVGGWLKSLFAGFKLRMIKAGTVHGAGYGGTWATAALLIMGTGSWLKETFLRIFGKSAVAGGISGVSFGTAFGVAAATALVAIIVAAIDSILENFTGYSFVRDLTSRLFGGPGTSVNDLVGAPTRGQTILEHAGIDAGIDNRERDAYGYTLGDAGSDNPFRYPSGVNPKFGPPSPTGLDVLEQNRDRLGTKFGTGSVGASSQDLVAALDRVDEDIGNQQGTFDYSNFDYGAATGGGQAPGFIGAPNPNTPDLGQVKFNTPQIDLGKFEEAIAIQEQENELKTLRLELLALDNELTENVSELNEGKIELITEGNELFGVNNKTVNLHTAHLNELIGNLRINIVEVIRNFNVLSEMTTAVSLTNLMFANLIAQGNRAAGKLASLRVSSTGKFSITDPGVSKFDQANIDNARENYLSTKANQVYVEPTINIEINPVINIEDVGDANLEDAAIKISDETADRLQKAASSLVF